MKNLAFTASTVFTLCWSMIAAANAQPSQALVHWPARPSALEIVAASKREWTVRWQGSDGNFESCRCVTTSGGLKCGVPQTGSSGDRVSTSKKSAVAPGGNVLIVRASEDRRALSAVNLDADGGPAWDLPDLVKTETGPLSIQVVQFVPRNGWVVIWQQPSGGTAAWKAQELDTSGRRRDPLAGVVLRESASENETTAAAVSANRQAAVAWVEPGNSAPQLCVWQWDVGRLQAPPQEAKDDAPGADDFIAVLPRKRDAWTVLWGQSEKGWTLRDSVVHPAGALGK